VPISTLGCGCNPGFRTQCEAPVIFHTIFTSLGASRTTPENPKSRADWAIDKHPGPEYFLNPRLSRVLRIRRILILVLLGATFCAAVVPRADAPETAFNEADTPVNLAPPVRPGIQLVAPAPHPTVASPAPLAYAPRYVLKTVARETAVLPNRHRHSLQELLCTFLI